MAATRIAIDSALVRPLNFGDTLYIDLARARLLALSGDSPRAYKMLDSIFSAYNRVCNPLLSHPYTTVLTDYLASVSSDRLAALHDARTRLWLWIAVAVLALSCVGMLIFIIARRKRINDIVTENLLSDIRRLNNALSELSRPATDNRLHMALVDSICSFESLDDPSPADESLLSSRLRALIDI